MESYYILVLLAGILVAFVLLVLIATDHFFKEQIPSDVDQPAKLRLYHCLYTLMDILVSLSCSGILGFSEKEKRGLPAWQDSQLFIKDLHFDGVPMRIYLPREPSASKRRGVIFIHGGCGIFGSIMLIFNSFNSLICTYVILNYFLMGYTPEFRYPAQTLECLSATVHFLKTADTYGVDPARIVVCGDSVGGTFATSVCQELVHRTDIPKIRAQVLIYPFLQALNFNLPSHQKNAAVPFLLRERAVHFILKYLNKDCSLKEPMLAGSHVPETINLKYRKWISPDLIPDEFKVGYKPPLPTLFLPQVHEEVQELFEPRVSPLLAEDAVVCALPDTCIVTCEHDVLRDDGLLYKKRLEDNNVHVTWHHVEKGFHAALGFFGYGIFSFPSSNTIINHAVDFIKGY
uniref:Alpha/beta hydrolase fold-3 domain-containing protein n=1 Tax=Zonotrichia albicollis TaxID=44394 RepID=A0A8D2N6L7_ZONAL